MKKKKKRALNIAMFYDELKFDRTFLAAYIISASRNSTFYPSNSKFWGGHDTLRSLPLNSRFLLGRCHFAGVPV